MKAILTARGYLGQVEKPNNDFDDDTPLGRLVRKSGHKDGEAWCCYFMEGVFCEALPEKEAELRKLFSASCVQTFKNFVKSGKYVITKKPTPGALVLWEKYKDGEPTGLGHAGICTIANSDTKFQSIEGNTSAAGSREGTIVGEQKNRDTLPKANGLNVLGFIIIEL